MAYTLQELERSIVIQAHNAKWAEVFDLCCVALQNPKASHDVKLHLSNVVGAKKMIAFNPIIKNAILRCFEDDHIEHQKFSIMWRDTLLQDPALGPLMESPAMISGNFWEENATQLNDPYLLLALRRFANTDEIVERFLIALRRYLLLSVWPNNIFKTKDLDVLCAVAEQCFINEYCFPVSEEEAQAVESLPLDDPFAVALRGMYEPLRDIEGVFKLSAQKSYRSMMNTMIKEPLRELEIKAALKTIGGVKDEISEKVQAQYEHNPYPRWISIDVASVPHVDGIEGNILIAGCGTGRMASQLCFSCPDMTITAVDISRTSLAYAQRQAEQYNRGNIEFLECDILNLDKVGKTFDFINCSGVLHHMNDPVAGWKKLVDCLAPGGVMLIGLYSTKARKVIYELRDFVKQEGYQPDVDGLRRFRQDILNLPVAHPHRVIIRFKDFYCLSDLRDLIFHVQETSYTIPELQTIMDGLGLEFDFFKMPSATVKSLFVQKFGAEAFPGTLEQWEAVEQETPQMFGEMYNFVCHKKGEALNPAASAIVGSGIIGPG